MNQSEIVRTKMAELFDIVEEADGTRVTTHCLYPSNGFVQVVVRGGQDTFYVSDEGGAVREIESAGAEVENVDRVLQSLVRPHALNVIRGVIISGQCTAAELGVAVSVVANVSKMVADWLFTHMRVGPHHNFKEVVSSFVRTAYSGHVQNETIVGGSNKPHKFENVIRMASGRRLIVDPVIKDHSSINARVVANMDVKAANHPDIDQRIVYDDNDDWRPEDLNLLQVGATVVAFSKAPDVLKRIARAN